MLKSSQILLLSSFLTLGLLASSSPLSAADGIQFRESETVVLLGDGYFEGEITACQLEAILTEANPNKKLVFRNLGWSGDTPRGESRSYFGPPEEGFQRLKKSLEEIKPTLVILNYGSAAAGDAALTAEKFTQGYERIVATLQALPSKPNPTFLAPLPRQEIGRAKEAVAALNKRTSEFAAITKQLAEKNSATFVDASKPLEAFSHSTETGLTVGGAVLTPAGHAKVSQIVAATILGKVTVAAPKQALVKAISRKNELVFNQWRPSNEIYLFGSRKHEQGNNAAEMPKFDPLITVAQDEIEKAKAAAIP